MKGEIDEIKITDGDLNNPLSLINKTSTQEVSREMDDINNAINQFKSN